MPPVVKKSTSLKLLVVKLKDIQATFNDIWRFVQNYPVDATICQISVRLDKVEELWEKFGETLIELKTHDEFVDEDNVYEEERQQFSDRYFSAKCFLTEKAREKEEQVQSRSGQTIDAMVHHDHVRLPQIKLQSFNGDIDDWLSFRDLYVSLIHSKLDLPEVEKFHYLKGCLQGEPKTLIDPLQLTAANYQIAWSLLVKRYNNSKQLRKRQVQALFKLPSLVKESVAELQNLVEGFERVVQTLDQIIQPVDYKDLLLVNLVVARLDPVTRRSWEEYSSTKEQDTVPDLVEFLHRRVRMLESLPAKQESRNVTQIQIQNRPKLPTNRTNYNVAQSTGLRCVACSANHLLYTCSTFQKMLVSDREALLRSHTLCRNCFKSEHMARECNSKFSCRTCQGRHHTLLCFRSENGTQPKPMASVRNGKSQANKDSTNGVTTFPQETATSPSRVANMAANNIPTADRSHQHSSQVLLATAVVVLEDDVGLQYPARALLDSGSESNFITERLSQRLRTTRNRVDIQIRGIGQSIARVKQRVQATVRSRLSEFSKRMEFLVLPKVTANLPTSTFNWSKWRIPEGIELADPSFNISHGVDVVLGIESFFDFFRNGGKISIGDHMPELNESVFGWVISGGPTISNHSYSICCNVSVSQRLEDLVARFWSCEEVGTTNNLSPEEARCEAQFVRTIKRDLGGRYTVSLPKDDDVLLRIGASRDIAVKRLQATERRLEKDFDLRKQYVEFMDEYICLGHMKRVDENANTAAPRCYLPHHPVIKDASTTTKVRVVFDASCKTSSGVSLNDALLVGPVIQDDLRSIILRCRTKQVMIVADVEKMFRQVNVCLEDRPLQSILWRNSPKDEIETFELNTVTYGTKPAPFLATRTLKQLALDEESKYPSAAAALLSDTYMDDVITGADNLEEAYELQYQLDNLTRAGGFNLRKWASNKAEVLRNVPEENLALRMSAGINLDPDPSVKALGLTWLPVSDMLCFNFHIEPLKEEQVLTKRQVLSIIATLFDPLGLLGAVVTTAKIFMQALWTIQDETGKKLAWDQPLPKAVDTRWRKYHRQLPLLNKIKVQRCVLIPKVIKMEIHCFSDASEKAYGACLYIRSINSQGTVKVELLSSKSKVAPLKCQTIPRLELCGALLSAQLFEKVQRSVKQTNFAAYFWTDSTCVLRWLHSAPTTWTTFVANRVAKIQLICENAHWRHVSGVDNPADMISRGILPEDLADNSFWWHGPGWLRNSSETWPQTLFLSHDAHIEGEQRRTAVTVTATAEPAFINSYLSQFSSYSDLVRRTALCQRFIKRLKDSKRKENVQFLSTDELKTAEYTIIKLTQEEEFAEELKALRKNNTVSRNSSLRWFNPFVDQDGLLRLGGRLKYADVPEDTKHPIILPARHRLTRLMFEYQHKKLLHAGVQQLLSIVRLRFWPLGGRNLAKQVVHQCVKCFRAKPTAIEQFMGELPAARVTASRPFSRTGVDYFGPLYVRPAPRRTAIKAYGAIFICMATKAVHIELVSDLSTERFLQALRRFTARRGRCAEIFSDNGTNFVGAKNRLNEIWTSLRSHECQESISRYCAEENIRWHFNPPSAPHFGGLCEAAVRSTKFHLLRVVGENPLSVEDMTTLLVQVEGCLNSRPITAVSDDPEDVEPLTPAHFLVGSSLQTIPELDLTNVPYNRLNQWQQVQRKVQGFWKRWQREYLSQLQARVKRWKPAIPISIGKLVVICDDNQPPMRWRMGKIVAVHPGSDGIVRVVTLRTEAGNIKRPVEKICLLPSVVQETQFYAEEVPKPNSN